MSNRLVTFNNINSRDADREFLILGVTANALPQLIRHIYRDGTFSQHYSIVAVNQNDALSCDDSISIIDPADRFTYWPPQPMTPWFEGCDASKQNAPAKGMTGA